MFVQSLLQWKINVTYSKCVAVALGNHQATPVRHIVMWPVQLYNIFPHYLIEGTIKKKKTNTKRVL